VKNAVPLLLLVGCSGPSEDDNDTDDTVDTGGPGGDAAQIWVNEVMPSNATGLQDEVGAFPDWIELYNPNAQDVDLAGWWVTEDTTDIFKWQVPDGVVIPGNGYLVLFADDDEEEGDLHTNFKLAGGGGDDVALFGPNTLDNPLVDSVEDIQALAPDIALARKPDGGPTWEIDNSPSPGEQND
jgi:hypothetical protein